MLLDPEKETLSVFEDELNKWKEHGFLEHNYVKMKPEPLSSDLYQRSKSIHQRQEQWILSQKSEIEKEEMKECKF